MKKKLKKMEKFVIKENFETQTKIPKPILIEIFQLSGLNSFKKISLASKQFYFLIKSENFWMKMLRSTDLSEIEIETKKKKKSLVEIYQYTRIGWNYEKSNLIHLKFDKNRVVHTEQGGIAAAVTKRIFTLGEENILFTFVINSEPNFSACGITKLNR